MAGELHRVTGFITRIGTTPDSFPRAGIGGSASWLARERLRPPQIKVEKKHRRTAKVVVNRPSRHIKPAEASPRRAGLLLRRGPNGTLPGRSPSRHRRNNMSAADAMFCWLCRHGQEKSTRSDGKSRAPEPNRRLTTRRTRFDGTQVLKRKRKVQTSSDVRGGPEAARGGFRAAQGQNGTRRGLRKTTAA